MRIFEAYWEVDRNEVGRLLFESMVKVLDEYGVVERHQRRTLRALWRAMNAEELQIQEAKRERRREAAAEAAKKGKRGQGSGGRRRSVESEDDEES